MFRFCGGFHNETCRRLLQSEEDILKLYNSGVRGPLQAGEKPAGGRVSSEENGS